MVEILGFLKKFGQEVGVQIGLEVVRGFLNEKIKDKTPADLYNAIKTNQDLWTVTPDEMKQTGSNLKERFGGLLEKYKDEINIERISKWLAEDHHDLYSIILNTPGGIQWLNNQVEKIKEKIIREL